MTDIWTDIINDTVTQYPLRRYGALSILSKSENGGIPEIIVAGYSSPQVIDRDMHVITKEALAKDLPRFMAHPHYRNVNLLHCLVAGTKVKAGDTLRNIEELVVGDLVLTHEGRLRPLTEVFKHKGPESLVELSLSNGVVVKITDEHKVQVADKSWIRSGDLTEGSLLPEGVSILSTDTIPSDAWVYNIEVEEDHSYAGEGIIYHNSNVTVEEVLPFWVNPKTGERFETKVDDIGLFTVCKIRTDPHRPPIVDKVIEDIMAGKIASFSISADAPFESRRRECAGGTCFFAIDEIILYEITLATVPGTTVDTNRGIIPVEEVQVGDKVYTHRRRQRTVSSAGMVWYEGEIIRITTEDGVLEVSPEHKIRVLREGKGRSEWVYPTDIREGDTVVSGANRKGGIQTSEGRARQIAGVTSPEFKQKRAEFMLQRWNDPTYRAAMVVRLAETRSKQTSETFVKRGKSIKDSWTEDRRVALSETMTNRWMDIEYKDKVSASLKKTLSSPEQKARLGKRLSNLREDPAFNEKMFKAMRMSPNKIETSLWDDIG